MGTKEDRGNIRRHPHYEKVPADIVRPLLERIRGNGPWTDVAHKLSFYRTTPTAWIRLIARVLKGEPVMPENADAIFIEAGEPPPPPAYRQRIYRVTGFDPWSGGQRNRAPRNWFYIRRKDAENRRADLKSKGLFIDWAVGEAVWKELP